MNTIPNGLRHYYVTRIIIFWITLALIVGMVGCGQSPEPEPEYTPMVAAGYDHTVGLKSDGTVVAVGDNWGGKCNVGGWTDITQVAAGQYNTVGLKSDGTVVAAGSHQYMVRTWTNITEIVSGSGHTVGLKSDGTVVAVGDNDDDQCNVGDWTDITRVAAADGYSYSTANLTRMVGHTVGLRADGTVIAVGQNYLGQCDVHDWTEITRVAAGSDYTVGLKKDGTVVAVGDNDYGQCDVGNWTDIVMIAAGGDCTVGVRSDGTVVAVGCADFGRCDVGEWIDMIQVAAGERHTVGLKKDGTVVVVGDNLHGQCDVASWTDIIWVTAGEYHTVGVRDDGTVVAVGANYSGQCDVGDWTDITQVFAHGGHTVGLRSDGTVVAVGTNRFGQCDVGNWTDIIQVSAGLTHTVGLRADGTVVAVGNNYSGQCDVGNWTDIIQIAAGGHLSGHTVGLRFGGTVVAVGNNQNGECDVGGWTDIVGISAGIYPFGGPTVGVKSDGTVVVLGSSIQGVGGWTDIVQVASGAYHTVGLRSDGTVVSVGDDDYGQRNVGGWMDITQVAAGSSYTVGLREDGTVVAAGLEVELAEWNLVLAVPTPYCTLHIFTRGGGFVTNPGEGPFTYDKGTVVDLVAEAGEIYRFVEWTGAVDTVANVKAAQTTVTVDDYYSISAEFEYDPEKVQVGVKAGDWIKYEYTITGWPAGEPYPQWLKLEFLSIEGTSIITRATLHMSDGAEQTDAVPVDIVGGGEALGLSGGVIPADLTAADYVYMTGYGKLWIKGETIRTYAGANRAVVYADYYQSGGEFTYYWDRQTGVMVESSVTDPYNGITSTAKATETNMW